MYKRELILKFITFYHNPLYLTRVHCTTFHQSALCYHAYFLYLWSQQWKASFAEKANPLNNRILRTTANIWRLSQSHTLLVSKNASVDTLRLVENPQWSKLVSRSLTFQTSDKQLNSNFCWNLDHWEYATNSWFSELAITPQTKVR